MNSVEWAKLVHDALEARLQTDHLGDLTVDDESRRAWQADDLDGFNVPD